VTESSHSPEALAFGRPAAGWRRQWFTVIFESDTPAGRRFDVALLAIICVSVLVVALETVERLNQEASGFFSVFEWTVTVIFTAEYIARLVCVERPVQYATSFFGVIDLAAVLPMYVATAVPDLHVLIDIRVLRMLRAFRILKLTEYVHEYGSLMSALRASRRRILVFVSAVAMFVVVLGTVMYVIEGPQHGFTSIPVSIYWAITTMTTVGFGDIAPRTDVGRAVSSLVMLLGWGILAVPTGIVTAEMTIRRLSGSPTTMRCRHCDNDVHVAGATFCHRCGALLGDRAGS